MEVADDDGDDDVGSLERRRRRRDRCVKTIVTALFSHVGLAAIVVSYTIMGGFLFQALEAPAEGREKLRIKKFKMDKVEELAQQAMLLRVNSIDRDNFTATVYDVLYQFQQQVTLAVKENGWDGNDDTEEAALQWSFAGALLYAVTVITTIGYGHVAPKTKWGRMITIAYAIVGIPLTFLYLSNMGNFMAKCFRIFYQKVCCGLCIYQKQFGLRICCDNEDDDDDGARAHRGGRRKTHIVLAAQYNRAFDDCTVDVAKTAATHAGDELSLPASKKENGGSAVAIELSSGQQVDDSAASVSANADRELDATVARTAGTDGSVVDNNTDYAGECRLSDAADDAADENDVSRAQENVPDDDTASKTNDKNDNIDNNYFDSTAADLNQSSGGYENTSFSENNSPTPTPSNETRNAHSSPFEATADSEATENGAADVDNSLADKAIESEANLTQFALVDTKNDYQSKPAPVSRRWKSMGAGSRQRRMIDTSTCDKAVDVHEDDLIVRTEPETGTGNETDAMSAAVTDEEGRAEDSDTVRDRGDEDSHTHPHIMGNLVLDIDELGILTSHDIKHEEMKVTVPISICLLIIGGYIFAGSMLFTLWEDWDYLTGSYFCFVTLSTIGFGDIVPGTGMKEWASGEKLVICALWLALGLSLLAMCFNLMQEEVKDKFEWCGRKLGLLKNEDDNG